jgi:hypothetical protein
MVIAANCQSVQVRSERDGNGNGRVYRIHLVAEDPNGNKTYASFRIEVRHNANTPAVEEAPVYTEVGACYPPKSVARVMTVPDGYRLEQNHPNPFSAGSFGSPFTSISYAVPGEMFVRIRVFDSYGREIRSLVNADVPAGTHTVAFDCSRLPGGAYLYRLEAGGIALSRTMTVVK